MVGADSVDRAGPLWRGTFGNRGFVSYRSLEGRTGQALDDLIAQTRSRIMPLTRRSSASSGRRVGTMRPPICPSA